MSIDRPPPPRQTSAITFANIDEMTEPVHLTRSSPEPPHQTLVRPRTNLNRSKSVPHDDWHQFISPQFMDDHGAHHYHAHTRDTDTDDDTLAEEEKDIYAVPSFNTASPSSNDTERPPLDRYATTKSRKSAKEDPYLVTWDGDNDRANPKNWTIGQKWAAVVCVSLFTFISPVSSSMSAPALANIGEDLHITSQVELTLSLSIFVAAYAIGPLFMGPLSEIYGRVIVLQLGNLFFLAWNVGCAWASSKGQLIAFRFLAGLGGSAPLAVGGGVLADCFTADQRGKAISIYSLMPLLGPAVGPVAGGFIAENTTWRWCFWSTSILTVIVQIAGLFFLRETWAPKILGTRAAKLRKEKGNEAYHTEWESPDRTLTKILKTSLSRPFILLGTQPIVQVLACYMAFLYGLMYLMLATFPALWTETYGESVGIGGLNYIALGLGFFIGTQTCAPLIDAIYRRLKKQNNDVGRPEFRVPLMGIGAILVPIGLFVYGWGAQYRVFWIVPDIGAAIFAAGTIIGFQAVQSYLIDSYSTYAASAVGAATFLRSLAGFGFPLFARAMFDALGLGWGNSLLAFVGIVLGVPAPFLLWRYGEALRKRSQFAAG